MKKVQDKSALAAGIWSAAIIAMGAFTLISYLENRWLLVASLIGSFFGTYITVKEAPMKRKWMETAIAATIGIAIGSIIGYFKYVHK